MCGTHTTIEMSTPCANPSAIRCAVGRKHLPSSAGHRRIRLMDSERGCRVTNGSNGSNGSGGDGFYGNSGLHVDGCAFRPSMLVEKRRKSGKFELMGLKKANKRQKNWQKSAKSGRKVMSEGELGWPMDWGRKWPKNCIQGFREFEDFWKTFWDFLRNDIFSNFTKMAKGHRVEVKKNSQKYAKNSSNLQQNFEHKKTVEKFHCKEIPWMS